MRFRVPAQGAQQAGDGIGNFFRSMAMAPMYAAQAADEAQTQEQKRLLSQSQIGENLANAALLQRNEQIKANELATLQGRPDMLRLAAAARAGVSVPEINAAIGERTHGAPMVGPRYLDAPIEGVGPSGRTAALDDVISSFFAPAMAMPADKLNFETLNKARGELQQQGILDQAVRAANAGNYMGSSALSSVLGKKAFEPFAAVGNTGTSINQVTGAQPVSNQSLFTQRQGESDALTGKMNAAAGASKASAANSYASANQHNAQTQKIRQEGASGGGAALPNERMFGKAPSGYRWKPDGSLESIPGGPNDRKTNEQLAGRETVDNVVAALRASYDALDAGGGINTTEKGALSNIGAAVSRSSPGQVVGGVFGTRNQKERDSIAQARPLLLQSIMKATGMSAKQMDSNVELKLYLATATDPTLTLEANREALDRIEQLYGSGALGKKNRVHQDGYTGSWADDGRQKNVTVEY